MLDPNSSLLRPRAARLQPSCLIKLLACRFPAAVGLAEIVRGAQPDLCRARPCACPLPTHDLRNGRISSSRRDGKLGGAPFPSEKFNEFCYTNVPAGNNGLM
jgi:hypothetical protein